MKESSRKILERMKSAGSDETFRASQVRAAFRDAGAKVEILHTRDRTTQKPSEFVMVVNRHGLSLSMAFKPGSKTLVRKPRGLSAYNMLNAIV